MFAMKQLGNGVLEKRDEIHFRDAYRNVMCSSQQMLITNSINNSITNGVNNGITNGITNGVTNGITNGITNGTFSATRQTTVSNLYRELGYPMPCAPETLQAIGRAAAKLYREAHNNEDPPSHDQESAGGVCLNVKTYMGEEGRQIVQKAIETVMSMTPEEAKKKRAEEAAQRKEEKKEKKRTEKEQALKDSMKPAPDQSTIVFFFSPPTGGARSQGTTSGA
jgi:hypothetical protein